MRHWFSLFLVPCVALLCTPMHAHVARSAGGNSSHIWVGAEYSNFNPDYGIPRLPGLGIYANTNLIGRFGVEGEARFLSFTKPSGLTEKSYLIGPNVAVFHRAHIYGNIRFVGGVGLINYPDDIGHGSYFEVAPAGDVEYQFSRKWRARLITSTSSYQALLACPECEATGSPRLATAVAFPTESADRVTYRLSWFLRRHDVRFCS